MSQKQLKAFMRKYIFSGEVSYYYFVCYQNLQYNQQMGCGTSKGLSLYQQKQNNEQRIRRVSTQPTKAYDRTSKQTEKQDGDLIDRMRKTSNRKKIKQTQPNLEQQNIPDLKISQLQNTTHQALLVQHDRRSKVNQKISYPYNCIGRLCFVNEIQAGQKKIFKPYLATGFLISPHLIITAAHFVEQYEKIGGQSIRFFLRSYPGQSFTSIKYQSRVVTSTYHQRLDTYQNNVSQDYALVRLDTPVKLEKYINLGHGFNECQSEAFIYGYPHESDQNQFNLVGMKGAIKEIDKDIIKYDIDTTIGESGSPIIVQYTDEQYFAIGIHSGKHKKEAYNSGCLLTKKAIENLNEWVRKCQSQSLEQKKLLRLTSDTYQDECKHVSVINLQQSHLKIYSFLTKLKPNFKVNDSFLQKNHQSSNTYINQAQFYYCEQNYHKSLALAEKGIRMDAIQQNHQSFLYCLIGMNYFQLKQYDLALYYYGQCIRCELQLNNQDKSRYIKCLNHIGEAFIQIDHIKKAKMFFNEARRLSKTAYKKVSKYQLASIINEGLVLQTQKDYAKAQSLFSSALKLSFQLSSFLVQQKAYILHNLANASFHLQKYDDWAQYMFACLWIMKKLSLKSNQSYLEWETQFIDCVDFVLRNAEKQLQWKIKRIFFILQLKTQKDSINKVFSKLKVGLMDRQ